MTVFTNPWVPWALAIFLTTVVGFLTICLHLEKATRDDWYRMAMANTALSAACLGLAIEMDEKEGAS